MRWWQELGAEDILVPTPEPRSALSLDDDVRSLLGPAHSTGLMPLQSS